MERENNNSTPPQRIKKMLEYEGQFTQECYRDADGLMIVAQFAREIGLHTDQMLRDVLREKTKSISTKLAMKIHNAKPKYQMDWLLYGEGDMLDPSAPKDRVPEPIQQPDSIATIASLVEMLKSKDEDIRKLMLELETAKQNIEKLEECIETLSSQQSNKKAG